MYTQATWSEIFMNVNMNSYVGPGISINMHIDKSDTNRYVFDGFVAREFTFHDVHTC